ncbi:hypothetical protein NKH18_15895 [Streptomyces sp. M10(2022)]
MLDGICEAAPAALRPGGLLLVVHSELSCPEETVRRLDQAGLSASISDRMTIPFGPVTRGRLPWLRDRGLLPVGRDQEELVIIRARKI